jgi:hypothetical protein
MLSYRGEELAADFAFLESAAGRSKGMLSTKLRSFPTPAGVTWQDVRLAVGEHQLQIDVRGKRKTFTFQEAGFEDRRRGAIPDRLWHLLRTFARCGGVIAFDTNRLDKSGRDNLKQNVSKLGKRLAALLLLEGSPFKNSRLSRRYEARFKIAAEEGIRFPTPADVTWDKVSITEVRHSVVLVAVEEAETIPV